MSDTLNTQPSFHSELSIAHTYSELAGDVLRDKAVHYTFVEMDETLNPRQRAEVEKILNMLTFEIAYRGLHKVKENSVDIA